MKCTGYFKELREGKNIIWNHHLSIFYHTLDEVPELDYHADKANGNLIIEGDNLLTLKTLLPMYAGKVKCIYIDPPYNTDDENWILRLIEVLFTSANRR